MINVVYRKQTTARPELHKDSNIQDGVDSTASSDNETEHEMSNVENRYLNNQSNEKDLPVSTDFIDSWTVLPNHIKYLGTLEPEKQSDDNITSCTGCYRMFGSLQWKNYCDACGLQTTARPELHKDSNIQDGVDSTASSDNETEHEMSNVENRYLNNQSNEKDLPVSTDFIDSWTVLPNHIKYLGTLEPEKQNDDNITSCTGCYTMFGSLQWKNYCDACGLAFCYKCVSNRLRLAFCSQRESCVCRSCFEIIPEIYRLKSSTQQMLNPKSPSILSRTSPIQTTTNASKKIVRFMDRTNQS
ncbi:hypothetical protein GJ496_008365 [Pomphorhynchus laevis]|nr:hypothetical protein GJ496_008365 [Pomphorhynchus laevis]